MMTTTYRSQDHRIAGAPHPLAQEHVEAGEPLEAIDLVDIVIAVEPAHRGAREAQIEALELLMERSAATGYDEVCWLETELVLAREAIS